MTVSHQFFLAGKPTSCSASDGVTDKFTGRVFARVSIPTRKHVEKAIAAGRHAQRKARAIPGYQRAAVLHQLADQILDHRREFEKLLCREAGKPLRDASGEVERTILTCRIAAEEATRIAGEFLPLDIADRHTGVHAIIRRMPVGLCSFITPFNFPLNLVMHKIAPAIACGCPFILKPAPQTPLTALLLGTLLTKSQLPSGFFSILPIHVNDAAPLVEDERIKLLSFTGSAAVGWMLKQQAGKKKVVLELGGSAACIVDEGVDMQHACKRIAAGAFAQSGQSCISVQRLLVHRSAYGILKRALLRQVRELVIGDPKRPSTIIGPLISRTEVDRILEWLSEAQQDGARILCGGGRPQRINHARVFLEPTLIEHVPRNSRLWQEEVFGPVLVMQPFDRFEQALELANDSRFGLQAGVFTRSLDHAMLAWRALEVGGVVINDVPTVRVDCMPYGGVKDSGFGREGLRSAIEEMTEPRSLILRIP